MELDLSKYTLEEIAIIRDKCDSYIRNHVDGFIYICKVRSYGRNWRELIGNLHSLQELCYRYYGEDGIVDVYSTNPDLNHLENYGDVMYIVSEEDYNKWEKYVHVKNSIPRIEEELVKWDNRDNVPFGSRPYFAPIFTHEDLNDYKKQLEDYDMSFTPPIRYSDKK
jgi:hypothetical protein